jgi:hypothetical protein
MSWQDAAQVGTVIVLSLGGGGAIVAGLSGWLGNLFAQRLAERQRLATEKELATQRARIDDGLARLDAALEHRNFLLQRLADLELQGLRECWQQTKQCHHHVNGLRPFDCGTDNDALEARLNETRAAHNTLLTKLGEWEPFLLAEFVGPLREARRVIAIELSQANRNRFNPDGWWEDGHNNRTALDEQIGLMLIALQQRIIALRVLAHER